MVVYVYIYIDIYHIHYWYIHIGICILRYCIYTYMCTGAKSLNTLWTVFGMAIHLPPSPLALSTSGRTPLSARWCLTEKPDVLCHRRREKKPLENGGCSRFWTILVEPQRKRRDWKKGGQKQGIAGNVYFYLRSETELFMKIPCQWFILKEKFRCRRECFVVFGWTVLSIQLNTPLQLNMEHEAEEKRQPKQLSKMIRPFSQEKSKSIALLLVGGGNLFRTFTWPGFSRWVLRFELGFCPQPRITVANEGLCWGFRTYKCNVMLVAGSRTKNRHVILVMSQHPGCGFCRSKF